MLVATRDDGPHAHAVHFGPAAPPRSLAARFTGGLQLVGSLVGIPLALIGGYSTYHANFSPESKCQALRANIVSMLDRKADASTLRLLVQRDIASFERDCGEVDADAVAAFKNLLTAERAPARHVERPKAEIVMVAPPAKVETVAKPEPKPAAPVVTKRDVKQEAKVETKVDTKPIKAEAKVEAKAEKPEIKTEIQPEKLEAKSVVASVPRSDAIDAAWINSVREALRESASRPQAVVPAPETVSVPAQPVTPQAATMLPAPVAVPAEASLTQNVPPVVRSAAPLPPANVIAPAPQVDANHPVPPAPIPDAQPAAN